MADVPKAIGNGPRRPKSRPNLADAGPRVASFGRIWSNFGRAWAEFGPLRASLVCVGPESANLGPMSIDLGLTSAEVGPEFWGASDGMRRDGGQNSGGGMTSTPESELSHAAWAAYRARPAAPCRADPQTPTQTHTHTQGGACGNSVDRQFRAPRHLKA